MQAKKEYDLQSGADSYHACCTELVQAASLVSPQKIPPSVQKIPPLGRHSIQKTPGFFFGLPSGPGSGYYFGIPQGTEGNIMVAGGNGSGKSAGIAMPTLRVWQGAICATDVKGELSGFYERLYQEGLVTRPYLTFAPMQVDGPSYDPFDWLLQDDEAHLVSNIWEIVFAILPILPNDHQPFWQETERGVFAAALLYYFKCGLSFSETIAVIMAQPISTLCKTLIESEDMRVYSFLGEAATMKPETLANIDRGLRNKLMLFAADPYISHAFRGRREGANCFTWKDLDTHNIFLRIPANKIEEWGGAINLMYTQLIRYLERRPEMHSVEGTSNIQTLLLMDEFARFDKLEIITDALATLRSKNVNICLMVQSVAQLDKTYSEYDRRIIFDNCQFQVILRANDADTQKYLCGLIGTHMCRHHSVSVHVDRDLCMTGFSEQISEVRELRVQPHELATLDDVLLLSPYGFNRVKKFRLYSENMKSMLFSTLKAICAGPVPVNKVEYAKEIISNDSKKNEGAKMLSIEERAANADKRVHAAEQQHRRDQRNERGVQKKKDQRRNYVIGELVTRYFPAVSGYEPGTDAENLTRFEPLEAFLSVLSVDKELVTELQERAAQLVSENPDGEWRLSI